MPGPYRNYRSRRNAGRDDGGEPAYGARLSAPGDDPYNPTSSLDSPASDVRIVSGSRPRFSSQPLQTPPPFSSAATTSARTPPRPTSQSSHSSASLPPSIQPRRGSSDNPLQWNFYRDEGLGLKFTRPRGMVDAMPTNRTQVRRRDERDGISGRGSWMNAGREYGNDGRRGERDYREPDRNRDDEIPARDRRARDRNEDKMEMDDLSPPQRSHDRGTTPMEGGTRQYLHPERASQLGNDRAEDHHLSHSDQHRPRQSSAPTFPSGPAPMDVPPAPPSASSDDPFHLVQRYFSIFKKMVDFTYSTETLPPRTRNERPLEVVLARVEMPLPAGVGGPADSAGDMIMVEARGTGRKDARANTVEKIRERILAEDLLRKAEEERDERKRSVGGRGRGRGGKGMNAAPTGSGKGKGRGRNLEPWEVEATSINVRGLKQEERRVPSAWDDEDEDIPIPTGSASASRMSRMSIDDDRDSGRSAWDSGTWGGGTGGSGSLKQPVNGDVQDGRMNPERLAFLDGSGGGTPSSTQDSRSSRVPFSPHRDKRRHTEQYAREQSSYSPPAIPRPNATLPHMDDVQRKFAAFYCKRNQLPAPYPHWHPAKPERGVSQGGWIARLTVPRHTFGGRQVGPIVGEGLARTKKDAGTRAWDMFTAHLLSIVDQGYVEQFRSLTMPFKERLKEVLDQPLKIDVVEGVLVRLGKICGELEEAAAFRIPKEREESNGQGGDLLGSLSRADSGWARGTGRAIRPEDVEIPSGLGGQDLPVVGKFREIVSAIEGNNVVVLSAETGAGKTTQVPQFILAWQRWKDANPWWEDKFGIDEERASASGRLTPASVIVTQPRRIAAISVAQRVASERGEMVGSGRCAVGYQVRFENKAPTVSRDEGRMVFCTSGILLRRFQDDPLLTGVTHIILDEVHERDLNTDLLLIIIRHLLHRRPDIKVILMSATAETELFQNYFKGFGTVGHNRLPPIVSVPGRLFPVKENHLEDVMEIVERWGVGGDLRGGRAGIRPRWDVKTERFLKSELDGISPSARRHAQEEDIPLDVLEALIAHISLTHPPGAILVFLPGWQEINGLMEMIKQDRYNVGFRDEGRFRVLPLHSSVPMQAQAEVFKSFGDRVRKVVLSTNIAETSVTINDVVYVIDSGKMRQNSYDADRRISSLASVWGSQSNIKQRIGRAGRCQPGIYYSLMSRHRRRKLPYSMPPELLRVDLQSTVLKIKALHLAKSSREVFAAAPEPPSSSNVYLAIDELKSLGALDDQENMTPLGKVLSELPVDPWIGKMVLQGAVLGVLDPIVTIAGGMEVGRGIYAIHPDEKQAAREWILKRFARGMESDQLTMWKAFEGWRKAEAQGGWAAGRDFAASNWLHVSSLTNVEKARKQFLKVLEDCRVVERSSGRWRGFREERSDELLGGEENNVNSQELDMVRAVLCGALYPNLAEIVAKDEYRGKSDWKLRLTGSSVNSWTGIMGSKGVAPTDGVGISRAGAHASADSMSVVSDFDDIDDGASNAEAPSDDSAALPPRLLCYQDKQQVDGGIYMRHTTKADPIGVALFANSRQVRLRDVQGQPGVIIDNWLAVQMGDSRRRQVIMDVREWIARYLDWAVWRRAGGGVGRLSGDEVLGGVYGGDGEGEELGGGDDAGNIREAMKSRNNVHLEWESLGRRLVKEVAMLVQAACERERERLQ